MLEERGRVCLLVFSNKFSTLSPRPAFVELVKVTEKMTFPVPGNEKDEGAVRTGSRVGWGGGRDPSAAGPPLVPFSGDALRMATMVLSGYMLTVMINK